MRKTPAYILIFTVLILGLGFGEMAWTRLSSSGCQDWQDELHRRVEAYSRMHLPDPAPQVQVQSTCGHSFMADALYFRWNKFLWLMGWRGVKPLEDSDLRMASTRELMQHPDMGAVKFVVRFDAALSADIRKRVEGLLEHYLKVEGPRQKLEFRRVKKLPEQPAAHGTTLALAPPATPKRSFHPPLLPAPEPQLRSSLWKVGNLIFAILLICAGGLFITELFQQLFRRRKKPAVANPQAEVRNQTTFAILVAPRVIRDFGERGSEIWRLLFQLDRERAGRRVLCYWEKDREGLVHFLGWLNDSTQESMLSFLNTEQLLQLTDKVQATTPARDAQRAALRILLDLARELGQCSQLAAAPLFMQLMTKREWQRVAQQLTRPRRRALAELLDKERAGWLRGRQDLHPGWFQSGTKEPMTLEQLTHRVRTTLQVDADQLRDQLYPDRDALQVVDSYFADLTLDTALNTDLMMLVLGSCQHRQATFSRLVERQDPNLQAALETCKDQQVALLLYECDPAVQNQVLTGLEGRRESVRMLLRGMEQDKQHSKSLRMQAKSLQRFVERQVLVADLLCVSDPR